MDSRSQEARTDTTPAVRVGPSTIIEGRGVFACQDFAEGDIIERCPAIVLSPEDRATIDKTALYDYYFGWNGDSAALALGYGSLYNHSYTPNARYIKNEPEQTIDFVAVRPIVTGDEIFVNYNGDPADQSPLWFTAV